MAALLWQAGRPSFRVRRLTQIAAETATATACTVRPARAGINPALNAVLGQPAIPVARADRPSLATLGPFQGYAARALPKSHSLRSLRTAAAVMTALIEAGLRDAIE